MKFIQSLIQEKTGLKVDLPDSSGGTTVNYRQSLTCERCGQSGHSIRSKCCESHNIQDPSNIDALFASLTCSS